VISILRLFSFSSIYCYVQSYSIYLQFDWGQRVPLAGDEAIRGDGGRLHIHIVVLVR
jgi:hypothetical protein